MQDLGDAAHRADAGAMGGEAEDQREDAGDDERERRQREHGPLPRGPRTLSRLQSQEEAGDAPMIAAK
jgi:hypothetical protein